MKMSTCLNTNYRGSKPTPSTSKQHSAYPHVNNSNIYWLKKVT